MALHNRKPSIQALLDAQAHIWNHIFNFINSMSLKCTLKLGIPDIIHKHGKPMLLSELINALPINKSKSSCIKRLMRIMIHSKFFVNVKISEEDDNDGYWLTTSSLLLLGDDASSMKPFVLAMLNPILTEPWHQFSEWFGTNYSTPFFTAHGATLWERAGHDEEMNTFFNESMASDTQLVSSIIIQDCRHVFEGLKSLVDVGGGTGTMAKAMVDAFPGMKGIVLDLPHVVANLEGSQDLTYVGGDMFESIPPADAVFMKWIMHDWPDDKCVTILKKCKLAISNKEKMGKVIIVDIVVVDKDEGSRHDSMETQLLFDMLMMTLTSGRERNEKEWANLFLDAGFSSYKITKMLGLRSFIEVYP